MMNMQPKHPSASMVPTASFKVVSDSRLRRRTPSPAWKGLTLQVLWPHEDSLEDRSAWQKAQNVHDNSTRVLVESKLTFLQGGCCRQRCGIELRGLQVGISGLPKKYLYSIPLSLQESPERRPLYSIANPDHFKLP